MYEIPRALNLKRWNTHWCKWIISHSWKEVVKSMYFIMMNKWMFYINLNHLLFSINQGSRNYSKFSQSCLHLAILALISSYRSEVVTILKLIYVPPIIWALFTYMIILYILYCLFYITMYFKVIRHISWSFKFSITVRIMTIFRFSKFQKCK